MNQGVGRFLLAAVTVIAAASTSMAGDFPRTPELALRGSRIVEGSGGASGLNLSIATGGRTRWVADFGGYRPDGGDGGAALLTTGIRRTLLEYGRLSSFGELQGGLLVAAGGDGGGGAFLLAPGLGIDVRHRSTALRLEVSRLQFLGVRAHADTRVSVGVVLGGGARDAAAAR